MDKTDKSILNLLQQNARITNKELATQMGLSTTPVFERVKKLEKNGIIKNYVALVDHKKVDRNLVSFVSVRLEKHSKGQMVSFQSAITRLPEVMECYHMAGSTDYLLKIAVSNMDDYKKFMTEKLSAIENVSSVESSFVMSEIKYETAYVV